MGFRVFGPAATAADEYGDATHHKIVENGVLEVWTPNRLITYGPSGWWRIEELRPDTGGQESHESSPTRRT